MQMGKRHKQNIYSLSIIGLDTNLLISLLLLVRIYVRSTSMRPIVTDRLAWSVGLSVGQSITVVSPAKTAQPIEMPFGLRTRVDQRNRVLDGGRLIPMGRGNFEGRKVAHCEV